MNYTYDAEPVLSGAEGNRLTGVSGAATATFVYDGDGKRVKVTAGGVTTAYVGEHYEWTGSTSTSKKYYYADGARIAMRVGGTLSWLLTDHLGSTAVTANASGTRTGELWYKPWGEYRGTAYGTTPTSYRFTGQREDATIGLYFYNARYYDAVLGRFIQPDTIVPQPGNPQSLNRYAYVLNNPLNYVDPTGHFTEEELLQWGVFIGPNQMRGVRDEAAISFWYYLLRAAEFGDKLSFFDAGKVLGSDRVSGEFVLEDGALHFVGDGGEKYRAAWEGFQRGGNAASQSLPREWTLAKTTGPRLHTEQQLRRYVNGPNSLTDPDYYEVSVGGYFGLGGGASVKRDRFGKFHLGVQIGIGFGKGGISITGGKLMQSATADPGQIALAVDGWGMGFQGGYWAGGALPVVNAGPQPIQFGFSTPGFAVAGGYTWQIP